MILRAVLFFSLAPAGMAWPAPLSLVPPQAGTYTAGAQTRCGDLSTPCEAPLASQGASTTPAPAMPAPPPPSAWTVGGSVATGVGGVSGAHGLATAVGGSVWARSPDGQWTLEAGVARETYPGVRVTVPAGFGRP